MLFPTNELAGRGRVIYEDDAGGDKAASMTPPSIYRSEPVPRLTGDAAAWADGLLRRSGVR